MKHRYDVEGAFDKFVEFVGVPLAIIATAGLLFYALVNVTVIIAKEIAR